MLPDRSVLIGQKLVENAKILKRYFRFFQFSLISLVQKIFKFPSKIFIVVIHWGIILDNEKIPIVCRSPGLALLPVLQAELLLYKFV